MYGVGKGISLCGNARDVGCVDISKLENQAI
jgi:hypothetical protein